MVVACWSSGEQECSSRSSDVDVSLLGALMIFHFLLQKIDSTLKECIPLLLMVIYDHTKYRNVHLQMSIHSSFRGGIVVLYFTPLLDGGIAVSFLITL